VPLQAQVYDETGQGAGSHNQKKVPENVRIEVKRLPKETGDAQDDVPG